MEKPFPTTDNRIQYLHPLRSTAMLEKPKRKVKSLASFIRLKTQNSKEVARFMVSVMRDGEQPMGHRMEAAKWLVDRSEGKAIDRSVMLKIETDPGRIRVGGDLTDSALAELIRTLAQPREVVSVDVGSTAVTTSTEPGGIGQTTEGELTPSNESAQGVTEE